MLRDYLASTVCHGAQTRKVQICELGVGTDKLVQWLTEEIPTPIERSIDQILASVDNNLGPLLVLDLQTTAEVEILHEGASGDYDLGQRLRWDVLVEFASIEAGP